MRSVTPTITPYCGSPYFFLESTRTAHRRLPSRPGVDYSNSAEFFFRRRPPAVKLALHIACATFMQPQPQAPAAVVDVDIILYHRNILGEHQSWSHMSSRELQFAFPCPWCYLDRLVNRERHAGPMIVLVVHLPVQDPDARCATTLSQMVVALPPCVTVTASRCCHPTSNYPQSYHFPAVPKIVLYLRH